jgi:hypothetical protein
MSIEYKSYNFEPPYNGGLIDPFPVSPLKKHPLGFLTIILFCFPVIGIGLFGVDPDATIVYITNTFGSFLVFLFPLGLLPIFTVPSGSFFSALSYSYYYFRCVLYNTTLRIKR